MQQLQEEIVVSTQNPIDPAAFEALRPHTKDVLSYYGEVGISLWRDLKEDAEYFLRFRFETKETAHDAWLSGDCLTTAEEIAPGALMLPSKYLLLDQLKRLVPEEE